MERDKKIQLLLDMQEHPERFSEQALQAILDDPDVRELMEATAELKQAMMNDEFGMMNDELNDELNDEFGIRNDELNDEFGIRNDEWGYAVGGAAANSSSFIRHSSFQKVAASVIGVLMASGIALAAIHIWSLTPTLSTKGEGNGYTQTSDTIRPSSSLPAEETDEAVPVRYNEATLEQILTDMAVYYGLTLRWKSEEAKTLRLFYIWNRQMSAAEAVCSMNSFERIRLELNDSILTADVQTNSPKQ